MSIRWNIRDRKTGNHIVVSQPPNMKGRDQLKTIIKNCSELGVMRGGK